MDVFQTMKEKKNYSNAAGEGGSAGLKRLNHHQIGGSSTGWMYVQTGKNDDPGLFQQHIFCAHQIKMLRQSKPGSGSKRPWC